MINIIDPWNPTQDEIKMWAYSENATCVQDWELAITELGNAELIVELVSDQKCFHKKFFLTCLYLLIGDAVKFKIYPEESIKSFIEKVRSNSNEDIKIWLERTEDLIQNPSKFNYELWCDGGYAHGRN